MINNTLLELTKASDKIFESKDLKVPTPKTEVLDRYKVYKENNLFSQAEQVQRAIRLEQVQGMGFQQVTPTEVFHMLMYPNQITWEDTNSVWGLDWFYNHVKYEHGLDSNSRFGLPKIYYKHPKHWFTSGEFLFDKLDNLKGQIPYGVVLRLAELKKLKLFNFFCVAAPSEMFREKPSPKWDLLDPVVCACMCDLNGYDLVENITYWFVAKW